MLFWLDLKYTRLTWVRYRFLKYCHSWPPFLCIWYTFSSQYPRSSILSIILVIVHEKYTMLDQRDRYNCWYVSASFEFANSQIPMISWFMPTMHTVLLQKRYTKYVVFGVGMIRFRLHIHLKNIAVNVGKIYCNNFNYLFVNIKSSDIYEKFNRM